MAESLRIPLRIVFYKEDGEWVAHCLEFDLIGTGDSRDSALALLAEAIEMQVHASLEYNNPANLFSPADGRVLRMFAAGRDVTLGEVKLTAIREENVAINSAEYREYDGAEAVCV